MSPDNRGSVRIAPGDGASVRIAPDNQASVKSRPRGRALGAHREAPFARCAGMSAERGCPPSNLRTASILKMWISAGAKGLQKFFWQFVPQTRIIATVLPGSCR